MPCWVAIDDVVLSQFNEFLRLRLLLFVLVVLLLIKLELLLLLLILGNKLESTGVTDESRSSSTSRCLINSGKLLCRSLFVLVRPPPPPPPLPPPDDGWLSSRPAVTSSRRSPPPRSPPRPLPPCSPHRSLSTVSNADNRLGDSDSRSLSSSPGW